MMYLFLIAGEIGTTLPPSLDAAPFIQPQVQPSAKEIRTAQPSVPPPPLTLTQPLKISQLDNQPLQVLTNPVLTIDALPTSFQASTDAEDLLPYTEEEDPQLSNTDLTPTTDSPFFARVFTSSSEPPPPSALKTSQLPAPEPSPAEPASSQPAYIIKPQVAKKERVSPVLTSFSLNNLPVTHLTEWSLDTGVEFGLQRSTNFPIEGIYTLKSEVKQSITQDNVFTSEQTGHYLQLKTVPNERLIKLTQIDPVTVRGFQLQMTFTGSCGVINPKAPNGAQCSFLPALVTDRTSIDPNTLTPKIIRQLGKAGAVISPETLAALEQPGFQNVGPDGQTVGLDLYVPNSGQSFGNTRGDRSKIDRYEDLEYSRALGFYRVKQIYKSNYRKAVLGRTIHGFTGILFDRNFPINASVQAVSQIFPTVDPQLKGSPDQPANVGANENLILSANNTRIPSNSFVIYQAGFGDANHPTSDQKGKPTAHFNSVWIGLSPVFTRQFNLTNRLANIGLERIINSSGGEGGAQSNLDFSTILDFGDQLQIIDSKTLKAFYAQIYLAFVERDADSVTSGVLSERVTYRPHISFTGNFTGDTSIFRYYGGVIAFSNPIAYLGMDFTHDFSHDFRLSAALIGYLNGDRDYYSKAESRLSKIFRFGSQFDLTTSASFRYALDRIPNNVIDSFLNNPIDNFVAVGLRLRLGLVALGVTRFFDVLPDSVPDSTGFELSVRLGKVGNLTGFFEPQRNLQNYGVVAQFNLGRDPNSPRLVFSWTHTDFNFGNDGRSNALTTVDNRFAVLLKIGAPSNPYASPINQGNYK